jgi:hypothetical protein
LFTIFFNALNGRTYTAGEIIGFSLAAAIGSTAFGVLCGLVCVRWLRSAHRPLKEIDVTMQIGMTMCCAYLTFFIAQYIFDISGVLACCAAGAMVAWLGPPIILNHETMHNVWGMAEWTLNTLIFLLAGLIIGHRVLGKVSAMDWLYMVILYLCLMGARAVTVVLLYPFISTIGHRCTRNEAIFMSWTGLRGAVGMALALIVEKTAPNDLDAETSRLFFYVGGIATLTLVINGTTAKPLLFKLGLLTTNSAEKMMVTNQIEKKLRTQMNKIVTEMIGEFNFTEADLEEVRMSCTLLQDMNMDVLYRDSERMSLLLANAVEDLQTPVTNPAEPMSPLTVPSGKRIFSMERQDSNERNEDDDDDDEESEERRKHLSHSHKKRKSYLRSSSARLKSDGTFGELSFRSRGSRFSRALSGAANTVGNSSMNTLKLQRMSRLLSVGQRTRSSVLISELLVYVRSIFLEIVRVKYWHFIEIGKLPRVSFSAQFLLYTIEVGLDEVSTTSRDNMPYSKDWECLEEEITNKGIWIDTLYFLEKYLSRACTNKLINPQLSFLETRKEKREVYMLTSFIEAHEHAQSKIHKFLSLTADDGAEEERDSLFKKNDDLTNNNNNNDNAAPPKYPQSPEEIQVIEESKRAVNSYCVFVLIFLLCKHSVSFRWRRLVNF